MQWISHQKLCPQPILSSSLQNINEPLPSETHLHKALAWAKSFSSLLAFTRRKVNLHLSKWDKVKKKSISKFPARERFCDLIHNETFQGCLWKVESYPPPPT